MTEYRDSVVETAFLSLAKKQRNRWRYTTTTSNQSIRRRTYRRKNVHEEGTRFLSQTTISQVEGSHFPDIGRNETATVVTQTAAQVIPLMLQPILAELASQWYSDVHLSSSSNTAQLCTDHESVCSNLLTCNLQDLPDSSRINDSDNMSPASNQNLFCTPHPKNGQYMFYYTDESNSRSSFIPSTSTAVGRPGR